MQAPISSSIVFFLVVFFFLFFFPVPSTAEWQLLNQSIGISAMHMQLLHTNKVIMFDRTDFGTSNLSLPAGKCRVDPNDTVLQVDCTAHSVEYDIADNIFRPLTVQTDTWCSSGSLSSDGRLIQTGGYNDGSRVIRTFTPCYDGNCDWLEEPESLLVRRWYATNQILPDGSIIIIGGRRQFNYEFYPKAAGKLELYDLEFLKETQDSDENNLYPFLHLLPDGNLFIFANTKSILLNYTTNTVVKTFPAIPGGEPRNYPSSGSSVLLPLNLTGDNQDPGKIDVDVLICGGAPQGSFSRARSGEFLPTLASCNRLRVTSENPEWETETMPLERVMGDMLLLPNGKVLIINGAGNGTAGWEMASNPVKNPVLYSPENTPTNRFEILDPSSIPRLYHSSCIVLPDGRVIVGGSNPNIYYNFSGVPFPTELSLEAFSPPYLSQPLVPLRPRIVFATPNEQLGYRQSFSVRFVLGESQREEISVHLLAPSFTTHSFSMNQRLLVLKLVRVWELAPYYHQVDALGPPTAEIAPPGYYLLFVVHAGIPSIGIWLRIQ